MSLIARRSFSAALLLLAIAGCSAGGSTPPTPIATPSPTPAMRGVVSPGFQPR